MSDALTSWRGIVPPSGQSRDSEEWCCPRGLKHFLRDRETKGCVSYPRLGPTILEKHAATANISSGLIWPRSTHRSVLSSLPCLLPSSNIVVFPNWARIPALPHPWKCRIILLVGGIFLLLLYTFFSVKWTRKFWIYLFIFKVTIPNEGNAAQACGAR